MGSNIQKLIIQAIKHSLEELKLDKVFREEFYLEPPSDSRFGDFSSNIAFRLSKQAKRPPFEIAKNITDKLKAHLPESALKDYIAEVKPEGAGFINFYLNDNYFYGRMRELIEHGPKPKPTEAAEKRKVLIEFVSANPTGPLSVAHARQAAVGDVLASIMKYLGFEVKKEYYLNDEGNQINILGRSVELRLKELSGEKIEFPEDHYQGEYICDIAREVQNAKPKVQNFSEYAVEYILDIIKKELDDFGVKFDNCYSQKKLRESGKIDKAFEFLKEKGLLYEQDGALWFKSTQFGDDKDRVVIKSDGSYTYLAPDIAYHRDKFARGFDWLINLWGPDHHGYIHRIKAAVAAFGKGADSLSVIIVQLASIFREGKPVQMSTRRGQYITLKEILDEVGVDAARFFFLMRRTSSHLDFDLEIAKKQTPENPVFYVQYAYARICSILHNAKDAGCQMPDKSKLKNIGLSILKEKEEIRLIKKLCQFTDCLNICLVTLDPYLLTVYLQELAEVFHKFYDQHRVLTGNNELSQARLLLLAAVRIIIAAGLDLLGIKKPEKM